MGDARTAALLVAPLLLVAGCMSGAVDCDSSTGSYRCSFGGSGQIDRSDTWENPNTRAEVSVDLGGSGEITVTVLDDDGTEVHRVSVSGTGGQSDSGTTDSGAPGTWTVEIEGNYAGGLDVEASSV